MSRKLRMEYEGAVYHVISRGNYRADVFRDDETKAAFLKCLGEAADKSGWRIHAWCVMSNHYHLCFTTPQPNLVEGMRWLQATFSLRFNRFRGERGHVFQGRYKALPVDPAATGAVCHYLHLNPLRARIVTLAELGDWPWTSLPMLRVARGRPRWFSPEEALGHAGGLDDTPVGRARYLKYLGWLQEDAAGKKSLEFEQMSKGWAVGDKEFKKELMVAHGEMRATARRGDSGPRELSMEHWEEKVAACLAALGKNAADVAAAAKGVGWKVAVAATVRGSTTASNPWLAQRLNMGSPFRLSRLVGECRENPTAWRGELKAIAKCKA